MILDVFLIRYNDDRRKTLFNTAVDLLSREDLRFVTATLEKLEEQPIGERALAAIGLLREAADRRGISLKLNKKGRGGGLMATSPGIAARKHVHLRCLRGHCP